MAAARPLAPEKLLPIVLGCAFGAAALAPSRASAADPPPEQVGRWIDVFSTPIGSVHTTLLPNGKVMFWGEYDDGYTPYLWDPATGGLTALTHLQYNPFCGGHGLLPDGRLFEVGGHVASHVGLPYASIYDPSADTWTRQTDMNAGRWYPSVITLASGEMLVVGGEMAGSGDNDPLPQVFNATTGTWRDLTGAQRNVPYYLHMFQAPNGKVFSNIPELDSYWLDTTGTGTWTKGPGMILRTKRWYGTAVMYQPGKILVAGGGDPPTYTAETIDLNAASPRWTAASPMSSARRQHNATILPDGRVLVTGGSSGATFNDSSFPVNFGEVWDPDSNTWTKWASAALYRGYHSGAVLLPDGRVFTGGGRTAAYDNAQVFEPPYLFKGARPSVSAAPRRIAPGQSFTVVSSDAASVEKVTLVRLGSVTHSWDMSQRFARLDFTAGAGQLQVAAPADNNFATPGNYMLFLVDATGVPSVGWMLQVGRDGEPSTGTIDPVDGGTLDSGAPDAGPADAGRNSRGDAGLFADAGASAPPDASVAQPKSKDDAGISDPPSATARSSGASSRGCSCGAASAPLLSLAAAAQLPLLRRRRRAGGSLRG